MDKLFNPKSICVLGASPKKASIGGIILRNLLELGFKGKIYPVNFKYKKINKLACFASIGEIQAEVDLAVIAIPATFVPGVIEAAATGKYSVKNFVIISAGFKEAGAIGEKLEDEIVHLAKKFGLKIVGPNCLGILNTKNHLNASFSRNNFLSGDVGLIMQSGALATALFDLSLNENIGFSKVATIGNKAVLDETDFLDFLGKDKETKIIGMYLEDIKRGREFMRVLGRIVKSKPVIIIKSGNSEKSMRAVVSHTGAMAGEKDTVRQALTQCGAVLADDLLDFIENLKMFKGFRKPKTNQVVILTNAGGAGVVTTDLIEKDKILELKEFNLKEKQKLLGVIPNGGSIRNPLDILGDAPAKVYARVLNVLRDMSGIGAVIAIATQQAGTDIRGIAGEVMKANSFCSFPVIPVIVGSSAHSEAQNVFKARRLNNFVFPLQAVSALQSFYLSVSKQYEIQPGNFKFLMTPPNLARIAESALRDHRDGLYFAESARLMNYYKISTPKTHYFGEKINQYTFPLVLKVDSPQIVHKKIKGGLMLNIQNETQLKQGIADLRSRFGGEEIIIQKQLPVGLELIFGIKQDKNFGRIILLGMGGSLAEIIGEKLMWLLPVAERDIKRDILGSKIGRILTRQGIAIELVMNEFLKVEKIAVENEWVRELDINPMMFYQDKLPMAVDVKVFL